MHVHIAELLALHIFFHAANFNCATGDRDWKCVGEMPDALKPYVLHGFLQTLLLVKKDKSIATALNEGRILEAISFADQDVKPEFSVLFKVADAGASPVARPRRMTVHHHAIPIAAADGVVAENSEEPLLPTVAGNIELRTEIDEMESRKAGICENTSSNPMPSELDSEILEAVFILHFNEYEVDKKKYYTLLKIDDVVYGRSGRAIQGVLMEMEKHKKNCNTTAFATMQYARYGDLNSGAGKNIADGHDTKIRADSSWSAGDWNLSFVGSDEGAKQSVLVYKNAAANTFVAYAVVGKKFKIFKGNPVSTGAEEQAKKDADQNVALVKPQIKFGGTESYYKKSVTTAISGALTVNYRDVKLIISYIELDNKQNGQIESTKFNTNLALCDLGTDGEFQYSIVALELHPDSPPFARIALYFTTLAEALTGAEEFAEKYKFWYYTTVGKNQSYNSIKSSAEKKIKAILEVKEKIAASSADSKPAEWNFSLIRNINIVPDMKLEGIKILRLFLVECTNKSDNSQKYVGVVKGSTSESLEGNRLNSSSSELKPNSNVTFTSETAPSSSASQNTTSKSLESSNSGSNLRISIGSSGEFRPLSNSRSFHFLKGSKNAYTSNWVISEIFDTPNTLLNSPDSDFENIYFNRQNEPLA